MVFNLKSIFGEYLRPPFIASSFLMIVKRSYPSLHNISLLVHHSSLCLFRSLCLCFSAFMASMAELRSHGVPILFPIDAHGIASVSDILLSIRFSFKARTIWVEREIFDPNIGLVVQTFHETSKLTANGNVIWELGPGKYRVYGIADS
jgi:hypothetical protein